jgi:hypothetical protein
VNRFRERRLGATLPLFAKGVSVGFGRTHDRRCTTQLRDLVVAGRAHPDRVVTITARSLRRPRSSTPSTAASTA